MGRCTAVRGVFIVAKVAISRASYSFDALYSYSVPEELAQKVKSGVRVLVPFGRGNRKAVGFVARTYTEAEYNDKLKPIISVVDVTLMDRAQATMSAKLDDSLLSSFVLAFFCGILMFSAVEGSRRCNEKKNFIGGVFIVVMPIMVFILSGFNHCVADAFYYCMAGCPNPLRALCYFPVAILGNLCGGVCIPLLKRLSRNPL